MFEKLKQRLLDRIERDAVRVPGLTYHPEKGGKGVTETIYLKRSKMPLTGDWQRIYPPVNEDGSWNVINLVFGGKKNLVRLLLFIGLAAVVLLAFQEIFGYVNYLEAACPPEVILSGFQLG